MRDNSIGSFDWSARKECQYHNPDGCGLDIEIWRDGLRFDGESITCGCWHKSAVAEIRDAAQRAKRREKP